MHPAPTVLKLAGELVEAPERLRGLAQAIVRAAEGGPIVVIHGGGREVDAALSRAGVPVRRVEGVRITDEPTLEVVIEILAGAINTRIVAAVGAAGGRAVGLTGVDADVAPVEVAPPQPTEDGGSVALGLVGRPAGRRPPALLLDLCSRGYIPIVASLGVTSDGHVLNVNADTLAADLAGRLRSGRLVIAGSTPGVLDGSGHPIQRMDEAAVGALIADRTATAGMVAKLNACRAAIRSGVPEVRIVDGRDPAGLEEAIAGRGAGTRIVAASAATRPMGSDMKMRAV